MDIKNKLFYIFTKRQRFQFCLLLLVLFIGALLELLGVSMVIPLFTAITDPKAVSEQKYMALAYQLLGLKSIHEFLILMAVLLIIVYVVKNLYLTGMYYLQYTFVFNNQLKLSAQLIECYLKKPYTYHLDKNSAEMVRNVMLDTERLFNLILSVLGVLSESMVAGLLCLFLLFTDPGITIIMAAVLGGCILLYMLLVKSRVRRYGRDNQTYDAKMHQSINQALGAVKDIKILHREHYFIDAFESYGRKKMRAVRNSNFFGQVPKYVMETVCILALLLLVLWKLRQGADFAALVTPLAAFGMAVIRLLPSVSKISNYLNSIIFLKPSIDLIYRDLKETEDTAGFELKEPAEPLKALEQKPGYIEVKNLSYAYPNMDRDVIKDVSFRIPIGAAVGFVGPSGAGKSTMADLILGILTPKSGQVLYGDMDVHRHPLKWSKKLAYIPQAIFLADESIRSNVAFGIEAAKIDEEMVFKALEEAQLKTFVEGLEEGLDTMVGERGVRLSGGQRQRIGIARALYDDPEILVLDEATSALDHETEKAVMESIDHLQGKKTLIIIAHRLTTIKNCDLVFHIEAGRITEKEGYRDDNG